MANTIDDIRSQVNKQGLAKANKYYVTFYGPVGTNDDKAKLALYCSGVSLAGRTMTTDLVKEYGQARQITYGHTYVELTTTFMCSEDLREKVFFDGWMNKIIQTPGKLTSDGAYDVEYYDNYIGGVDVTLADDNLTPRYTMRYFEAYPKTVSPLDLDYGTNNTLLRLQITWNYTYWETLYSGVGIGGRGSASTIEGAGDRAAYRTAQERAQISNLGTGAQ